MESTFRASMNWLHTWAGVVLGGLLFAVLWTGTLVVFDREIDLWMMPATRVAMPREISLDSLRPILDQAAAAKVPVWTAFLPTERQPAARLRWRDGAATVTQYVDISTCTVLPDPGTLAGTYFLYPFHYGLHIGFRDVGIWLVGLAGIAMLVLCVSGVIVHRRIFADFFTLRRIGRQPRFLLDLHNISGVLGLPFHFAITLSGLIAFWSIYFPGSWQAAYGTRAALSADSLGIQSRPKADRLAAVASLDVMLEEVRRLWDDDMPRFVSVTHPGDEGALVSFARGYHRSVMAPADRVTFDGATGSRLHWHADALPVATAQRFILGLHLVQFHHWTVRWVYFALGLTGCVLIATGHLFWLESRRKRHAQLGLKGVHVVDSLTIGSVTGIVIATLAFFVVNRLLPLGATLAGYERAALEVGIFYLVWLATFAHAWLRLGRAWVEQCWTIATFAAAAMLLNWITTSDHLIRSLSHRHLWPIAGMDLLLLAGAAAAALTARNLQRRASATLEHRAPARATDSRAAAE